MRIHSLVDLCRLLNDKQVRYAVAGAHACALHGHIRATEDYDVLVSADDTNLKKVMGIIEILLPENTDPLTIEEIRESVVVKTLGEIEVDFMLQAWSVDFATAQSDLRYAEIDGVVIPFLGLGSLIASKSTARELDQWDVSVLRSIQRNEQKKDEA